LYFTPRVLLRRRFKNYLAKISCRLTQLYRSSSAGVVNELVLMLVCHRLPLVTALLPLTIIFRNFPSEQKASSSHPRSAGLSYDPPPSGHENIWYL